MKEKGRLAFPCVAPELGAVWDDGMSLREYYAGLAMQGMMSQEIRSLRENIVPGKGETFSQAIAHEALGVADALIAALEAMED